jgi:hypothetical protein
LIKEEINALKQSESKASNEKILTSQTEQKHFLHQERPHFAQEVTRFPLVPFTVDNRTVVLFPKLTKEYDK